MTPPTTTFVTVLCGLGAAGGLVLIATGWSGARAGNQVRARIRHAWGSDQHRLRRLAVATGAGLVAGVATGWLVGAVLTGAAAWYVPRLVGPDRVTAHRIDRIEAIASWTEMVRDVLSAAAGLEQAILATAPLAPSPIRAEVTTLAARLRSGQRLTPALRQLADEVADPTADLVIASLVLAAEHEARQLSTLLSSLAATAREQAAMRMRVETGRARTRTSVRVIVATTLAFAGGIVVFNRSYFDPFGTIQGQLMLLLIGGSFAAGFTWLSRIATNDLPPRVLALNTSSPVSESARRTGGGPQR